MNTVEPTRPRMTVLTSAEEIRRGLRIQILMLKICEILHYNAITERELSNAAPKSKSLMQSTLGAQPCFVSMTSVS